MSLLQLHHLVSVPQPQCGLSPPLSSNVSLKTSTLRPVVTRVSPAQVQATSIQRRSANYEPAIWDYNYIQSIKTYHVEESQEKRAKKLEEEVRKMVDGVVDPLHQLELIDVLERLGLSHHFDNAIETILTTIYHNGLSSSTSDEDLHAVALEFRLLRQHGFDVPQEVFNHFMDDSGDFKACLCENTKGILSLYEASYVLVEGESVLEKARDFATQHLEDYVKNHYKFNEEDDEGQELSISNIQHPLEFPQHWRVRRVESRWFIDAYEKRHDKNHVLLELAKLDFNMLQAIHQEDLKDKSRWWNEIGVAQKLSFSRDRLMENFLWTVAFAHEPRFQYFRRMTTEIYALITTVDDVYDVYGTLDELKLFTNAIERWDLSAMEQLPDYMKLCFMAVFNSTNKLAFDVLNKQGIDVIHYLKKSWLDLCKAYLLEAGWYYSGYKPSLEEYMENSWMSVGVPAVLVHVYFSVANTVTEEALTAVENYHDLIRYSSLILRLEDDLGTSTDEQERGDIPKSVQCYMLETGGSEEEAREYVKDLVKTTWTKMNRAATDRCPFPKDYVSVALNVARMSQHMYQHGDGHASQNQASKDRIMSLLIQPIPLEQLV